MVHTDRNVVADHRWRWVSLAAAAAAALALVAGLVVWTRDDSSNIDVPPAPGAGDNTVVIVQGDHTDAAVTPTAVAGIVSFDITNPTDGYRGVEILPLLPGVTIDDVRAAAAAFVPEVADTSGLLGDAVLGVDNGPQDHFVTAMALDAGDYAVVFTTSDATLAPMPPPDGYEVRQLSVATGNAGAAPAPTLVFERLAMDGLIGPTTAPRGR